MQHPAVILAVTFASCTLGLSAAPAFQETSQAELLAGLLPSATAEVRKSAFAEIAASEDDTYACAQHGGAKVAAAAA